jgi:membrane protein DedA with SNARE-associated domain
MLPLTHTIADYVATYGLPALFVSVALESLGLPFPGESAVLIAATSAASGVFSIYGVAFAAIAGAVLGDNTGYYIGRRYGRDVVIRHGGKVGITEKDMARVEAFSDKYGPFMVVFARFFVVTRQLNGIVAGVTRMHWLSFLVANIVGAVLWVSFWATLAYKFGQKFDILPKIMHHLSYFAAGGVLLFLGLIVVMRLRAKRN